MADSKVAFELVAPERLLASIDCDMVVIPGADGDFGVLPQHAPLMSLLRPGVIAIYQGDRVEERVFVAGGFAEVNEKGCTVLAERAEPLDEIPSRDRAPGPARRRGGRGRREDRPRARPADQGGRDRPGAGRGGRGAISGRSLGVDDPRKFPNRLPRVGSFSHRERELPVGLGDRVLGLADHDRATVVAGLADLDVQRDSARKSTPYWAAQARAPPWAKISVGGRSSGSRNRTCSRRCRAPARRPCGTC